jgi:raffinose/stachyose/melibiose transport system permease protein/N-acetylglucosamine transport system permease protein
MIDFKLYDTYLGMIIMSAGGFGFSFFLLYGFFKNISWSYAEAAFIDSAGHWTVFLRIMLPQAKPAIVALAIISGIGVWNNFSSQFVFYKTHPTVAVGLKRLSDYIVSYGADYPRYFAAIVMSCLPVVIIYASCQKMIIKNTVAGGLKG